MEALKALIKKVLTVGAIAVIAALALLTLFGGKGNQEGAVEENPAAPSSTTAAPIQVPTAPPGWNERIEVGKEYVVKTSTTMWSTPYITATKAINFGQAPVGSRCLFTTSNVNGTTTAYFDNAGKTRRVSCQMSDPAGRLQKGLAWLDFLPGTFVPAPTGAGPSTSNGPTRQPSQTEEQGAGIDLPYFTRYLLLLVVITIYLGLQTLTFVISPTYNLPPMELAFKGARGQIDTIVNWHVVNPVAYLFFRLLSNPQTRLQGAISNELTLRAAPLSFRQVKANNRILVADETTGYDLLERVNARIALAGMAVRSIDLQNVRGLGGLEETATKVQTAADSGLSARNYARKLGIKPTDGPWPHLVAAFLSILDRGVDAVTGSQISAEEQAGEQMAEEEIAGEEQAAGTGGILGVIGRRRGGKK